MNYLKLHLFSGSATLKGTIAFNIMFCKPGSNFGDNKHLFIDVAY